MRIRTGLASAVALVAVYALFAFAVLAPAGPAIGYRAFLDAVHEGRVQSTETWGSRATAVVDGAPVEVSVPDGADIRADIAREALAGGHGYSIGSIGDGSVTSRVVLATPFVPVALLAVGTILWTDAVRRRGATPEPLTAPA